MYRYQVTHRLRLNMAHQVSLLLFIIFSRLSAGVYLYMKTGGSITIPCHYDQKYTRHVKYWCKGYDWNSCSYAARTDDNKSRGRTSISDNITERFFTVTMTDLDRADSDKYWCVVEINGGLDISIQLFYLSVSSATPRLYVAQQKVTGIEGGSVTVWCYYSIPGKAIWCRTGVSCMSTINGAAVTLGHTVDVKNRKVLTITMSGLMMRHTGWYWCLKGDHGIPVHITVNQHVTTQSYTTGIKKTQTPANQQPSVFFISGPVVNTSQTTDGSPGTVEENTTQGSEESKEEDDNQWLLKLFLLGLLVLLIAGVLVAYKIWRKSGDNKTNDQSTSKMPDPFSEDVIYSTVVVKRRTRTRAQTNAEPDDNVVYSAVAQQMKTQAEPNDNVVYSSVLKVTKQQGAPQLCLNE